MSHMRHYTAAGPVEVRRADGTTEVQTAYSTAEFYAVVANKNDKKVNRAKKARKGT
jgi:hypothetical protein